MKSQTILTVIVGRIFGLVPLSIYTLAYRLPEMLLIGNLWVMGGVVFPAFSTIQDQPNELRRGFLASVRYVELIAVPICLGLLIAADPIVRVVFGDQWLDAIPVLRVLAVYAWVYSLGYHVGGFYKAIGRPDILLRLSILTLVIIIPALLIGARFGIIGAGSAGDGAHHLWCFNCNCGAESILTTDPHHPGGGAQLSRRFMVD